MDMAGETVAALVFLQWLVEMAVKVCRPPHFDGRAGGQMWWETLREKTVGVVGEKKMASLHWKLLKPIACDH